MGKISRGGYVFLTYKGDHDPQHVHVYVKGREVAKYNLARGCLMSGKINRRILRILKELVREGRL